MRYCSNRGKVAALNDIELAETKVDEKAPDAEDEKAHAPNPPKLSYFRSYFTRKYIILTLLVEVGFAAPGWLATYFSSSSSRFLAEHQQYLVDCHGVNLQANNETHNFVKTSTIPSFDMSVYPLHKDVVISKHITDQGCWECHMVRRVMLALLKHKNAYLVDIGGNMGMFAMSAAAMGRKVFVFEPLKQSYAHICRTVEKNGFHDQVHLFRVAAARRLSKMSLFTFGKKNMGGTGTRVIKDAGTESLSSQQEEGVNYVTGVPIDSVRTAFPKNRPAVIKIDVEGVEIDALAGAKKFLRETDIILAQMELRPPALLQNPETDVVFQILLSRGLIPMLNMDNQLVPMEGDWREWKDKYSLGRLFDVSWVHRSHWDYN